MIYMFLPKEIFWCMLLQIFSLHTRAPTYTLPSFKKNEIIPYILFHHLCVHLTYLFLCLLTSTYAVIFNGCLGIHQVQAS